MLPNESQTNTNTPALPAREAADAGHGGTVARLYQSFAAPCRSSCRLAKSFRSAVGGAECPGSRYSIGASSKNTAVRSPARRTLLWSALAGGGPLRRWATAFWLTWVLPEVFAAALRGEASEAGLVHAAVRCGDVHHREHRPDLG